MKLDREDIDLVSHWGYFSTEEMFSRLQDLEYRPGSPHPGVFFMPPHFVALAFADGVWSEVNARCGTTLDAFEEDDLSPEQMRSIAEVIREIGKRYVNGEVRRTVGWKEGPIRVPINAEMTANDFRALLEDLGLFLESLANEGAGVIASL